MKLTGHIITDSRNHGSQYISTTFSFNNAVKYATTGYKKIGRIAVIDMSKVSPDCIHNCSSYEAAYSELGCCTRAV